MSDVKIRYFIGEGELADKVISEGVQLANQVNAKRRAFMDEISAYGLWERRNSTPSGIIFEGDGEKKPGYRSPSKIDHNGKTCWIYKPNRSTKIGKSILNRLPFLAIFNFSDFACDKFGVRKTVIGAASNSRTAMAMYFSVAGYVNNHLVFKIPFGGDSTDAFVIPSTLREIKKSEFIAITEEGVPE